MATPNAAYSVQIRLQTPNAPGFLGKVTTAIGAAGGNITAIDMVEGGGKVSTKDLFVECRNEAHADEIRDALDAIDEITVVSVLDRTFGLHQGGKIEVTSKIPLKDRADLSMAYTPGVARICNAIAAEPARVHELTIKKNTIAVVTDGTAVLGLGDIGPAAGLPVMEGKALLFKEFAGIDAFPICLDVSSAEEIIETV